MERLKIFFQEKLENIRLKSILGRLPVFVLFFGLLFGSLGINNVSASSFSLPSGSQYSYAFIYRDDTGKYVAFFTPSPVVVNSPTDFSYTGDAQTSSSSTGSGDWSSFYSANSTWTTRNAKTIVFSNYDIKNSSGTVVFRQPVVSPVQAQTTKLALTAFSTTFTANSKLYLTVGVLVFGTLLGVSLIPRLLRLVR